MTDLSQFTAIILAAGTSSRLPGENKLLKSLRGKPLLTHTLETISSLKLMRPILVTGHDAEKIEPIAAEYPIKIVRNLNPQSGMASSIAVAAANIPDQAIGLFIILGDMPCIAPEDYESLASAFSPASICVPTFEGQRGHPVLFDITYRPSLMELTGDKGAKSVIKKNADKVQEVPVASNRILIDMDKQEDFASHED